MKPRTPHRDRRPFEGRNFNNKAILVTAFVILLCVPLAAPGKPVPAPALATVAEAGAAQDGAKDADVAANTGKDGAEATGTDDGNGIGWIPIYLPQLTILRAAGPIEVNAELTDPGWKGAAKATNFAEHNPGDQTKPDVHTEVLITYDDDNLYVGWICHDDPAQVRASFCERDRFFNTDDYVILCLDTFGESALAYEIAANPHGIQGDLLYSAANGEDVSYDMVFESAGKITDFGWVVEMAIPLSGMRFPDRNEQVWRVDFWRNRPRESRYQYSWAAYNRDENCWPCKWGTVRGVAGVKSGAGLEILPSMVAHQSGALNDGSDFRNDNLTGDLGLGIAYDISSQWTAEAAINPDFSQVESDAAQIDVNTTFALFYPEKRPFFQEGSDLFNSYFNAVYTRSVNDPLLAGKTTWRKGSNSVAFLSARDEHSVIILPFEESSEFISNGKSYTNIIRARHDFGNQSHLGLIATDRRFDSGGSGSLAGIDGQYRFTKSDAFRFQVLTSHTEEVDNLALADSSFNEERFDNGKHTAGLDGEAYSGHGIFACMYRDTRNYWTGVEYWERSPTFRADVGFEPSNSWRMGNLWFGAIKRFDDSKVLENISVDANAAQKYNFEGVKKDEWIDTSYQMRFRAAQTSTHSRFMMSNERFGGIQFDGIWLVHNCFNTQPNHKLRLGGNYDFGHRIARGDLVMGKETVWGIWADIQPIDRLMISPSLNHIHSNDVDTDERLFEQTVFRSRFSLQFSRELSARLITQYNEGRNSWDIDPLLTYRLNPFTMVYVGSTHDFRNLTMEDDGREGWTKTGRQYFLKVQYLWQI